MPICRFYQSGDCKYGSSCKFDHIDPPDGPPPPKHVNDPFSAPHRPPGHSHSGRKPQQRPIWPLSCLASEDNPHHENALDDDFSPEELRALAYGAAPRGKSAEVSQKEAAMVAEHRAKLDAVTRPPHASNKSSNAHHAQPPNDPFSNAPATQLQATDPFSNAPAFPMEVANGGQFQQNMAAEQSMPSPFGKPNAPVPNNLFNQLATAPALQPSAAPLTGMSQQAHAQHQQGGNAHVDEQFASSQFGFGNVPEVAPPSNFF